MKAHRAVPVCLAFSLFATAAFAAPSDMVSHRRSDFFAQGRHQFYLWCANGRDRIAWQEGSSAEDAQAKLSRSAAEPAGCQAVWQGRLAL